MPRKTAITPPPREAWAQWPQTNDLVPWMQALLRLTDRMDNLQDRAATVVFNAITLLAALGEPVEALHWVERLDRTVPDTAYRPENGHHHARFVMLAAGIALDAGMTEVMEDYLERMRGMQALFPRPCDRGYAEKRVRDFRARHGLLDAQDAVDEKQSAEARFHTRLRAARQAQDRGDTAEAGRLLGEALPIVEQFAPFSQKFARFQVAEGLKRAGEEDALRRLLEADDGAGPDRRFLAQQLLRLGQRDRAVARYQEEARQAVAELGADRLNAHFPARQLEYAVVALADLGERTAARAWLARALQDDALQEIPRRGASPSAVFQSLARAAARVEGPDAALPLLGLAAERAASAKESVWRTAELAGVTELSVELGPTDEAEAAARAVRSPKERRRLLVNLYARRRDWANLHATLDTAKTPSEAAQLVYDLKFIWRPETLVGSPD